MKPDTEKSGFHDVHAIVARARSRAVRAERPSSIEIESATNIAPTPGAILSSFANAGRRRPRFLLSPRNRQADPRRPVALSPGDPSTNVFIVAKGIVKVIYLTGGSGLHDDYYREGMVGRTTPDRSGQAAQFLVGPSRRRYPIALLAHRSGRVRPTTSFANKIVVVKTGATAGQVDHPFSDIPLTRRMTRGTEKIATGDRATGLS